MKWLKDTIRNELNELLGNEGFRDAQNSTSVLTAQRFLTRAPQKKLFSFDVAILAKNTDGEYCTMCGPNFCAAKLTHDLRKLK